MKASVIESNMSTGFRVAIILIVATWAGVSMAATPLHTRTPVSNVESCDSVNWNPDLQAQFPWMKAGCREVVVVDGTKWARFNVDFVRRNPDGTVVFNFKDVNGKTMHRVTLEPGPGQRAMIERQSYSFADLMRGQNLDLYVPENMYAVATTPGEPREELAKVVAPTEKTEVAQVETSPAPTARELPRTAGPLPLVLLTGLLSIIAGLGLTIRRKLGH